MKTDIKSVDPKIEQNNTSETVKGGGQKKVKPSAKKALKQNAEFKAKVDDNKVMCVGKIKDKDTGKVSKCNEHLEYGKNIDYVLVYLPDKTPVIRVTCKRCGQKYEIYKDTDKPVPVDEFKKVWDELSVKEKGEVKASRIREMAEDRVKKLKEKAEAMLKARNELADRILERAIKQEEDDKAFAEKKKELSAKATEKTKAAKTAKETRTAKKRFEMNKTIVLTKVPEHILKMLEDEQDPKKKAKIQVFVDETRSQISVMQKRQSVLEKEHLAKLAEIQKENEFTITERKEFRKTKLEKANQQGKNGEKGSFGKRTTKAEREAAAKQRKIEGKKTFDVSGMIPNSNPARKINRRRKREPMDWQERAKMLGERRADRAQRNSIQNAKMKAKREADEMRFIMSEKLRTGRKDKAAKDTYLTKGGIPKAKTKKFVAPKAVSLTEQTKMEYYDVLLWRKSKENEPANTESVLIKTDTLAVAASTFKGTAQVIFEKECKNHSDLSHIEFYIKNRTKDKYVRGKLMLTLAKEKQKKKAKKLDASSVSDAAA